MRFLMVAWTIPPNASGMAVVIRNLLRWFRPDEAVILGQIPYEGRIALSGIENHHRIVIPSYTISWRIKRQLDPFYTIPLAVRAGIAAVRQFGLQAVVAAFPNASFLIAGYLIARYLNIPFFPYFHNLYVETRMNTLGTVAARAIHHHILAHSTRIFSMSEGMSDFLRTRYGVVTTPLVHALNEPIPQVTELPVPKAPIKIGVSGNVNYSVLEPLRNLIRAIGNDVNYVIIFHTPSSSIEIQERLGIWANNIVTKDLVKPSELVASLKSCDLLVIGLENKAGNKHELDFKTQFPTRTLELLISERPILLLCPNDYFLAEFFRKWGCGLVLQSMNPMEIREAIERMCNNQEERIWYVTNCLQVAKLFQGERVAAVLRRELTMATDNGAKLR